VLALNILSIQTPHLYIFFIMAKAKGKSSQKMDDWASSLAKQASSSDSAVKVLPKEERKQKRAAKKARRDQAKPQVLKQHREIDTTEAVTKLKTDLSRRRLKKLSQLLHALKSHSRKKEESSKQRRYVPRAKDKISKHRRKRLQWNQETIQPRPCDYSGIGLARESLYVPFLDPSYVPKLEEEFRQHIPGFYGKTRTKAMKRQLDGNMLWRQLADNKQNLPKRFKSMTPDERVQAMIESGMV
jgi:hypothetical protein